MEFYGKLSPIVKSISESDRLKEKEAEQRKENLKDKLRELFKSGRVPGTITDAEILKILYPKALPENYTKSQLNQKIGSAIFSMFPSTSKREFIKLQYDFYLENQNK
jgi:hypothetical protein